MFHICQVFLKPGQLKKRGRILKDEIIFELDFKRISIREFGTRAFSKEKSKYFRNIVLE